MIADGGGDDLRRSFEHGTAEDLRGPGPRSLAPTYLRMYAGSQIGRETQTMATRKRQPTAAVRKFLEQLTALMKEKEISQAELARRMDRPESYVSKLLRGGSDLTPATMERIAAAMDTELDLQLKAPGASAAGTAEAPEGDAPTDTTATPEQRQPPPRKRREVARAKAHALAEQYKSSPEVLAEFARILPKTENPVGRPQGPVYDYEEHLHRMAILLVSGQATSERDAANQTEEWAKNQGLVGTASTLRRHFAQDRETYLKGAEFELARERREAAAATAEAPQPERPRRVWKRASGAAGGGEGGGLGRPLSSYDSVTRELTRLHDELRFPMEVMESLKTPYVLEEVGKIAAELDAIQQEAAPRLDTEELSPTRAISQEVAEMADGVGSVARDATLGIAGKDFLPESVAARLAREVDPASAIRRATEMHELLPANRYFDDLY